MGMNYLILFENDETGEIRNVQKIYDIDVAKQIVEKYVKCGETGRVYTLIDNYGRSDS